MEIREPKTAKEFEDYYHLRWEILRKPWAQPVGSEKDLIEDRCIHAMAVDATQNVLAVCRLQFNDPKTAQIRYMAVAENLQGKGLGSKILIFLEDIAKDRGAHKIVLDARENAASFYRKNGYRITEKGYLLYKSIQHWKMEKNFWPLFVIDHHRRFPITHNDYFGIW